MSCAKKAVLSSLLMLGFSSAFANSSDMRVAGTIAPAACVAVFTGGGALDFGEIDPASLNPPGSPGTFLPALRVAFTISCDAPIAIATTWVDGRPDSGWSNFFGLGLHEGVSVGGYRVWRDAATGDGRRVDSLTSQDGGATWRTITRTEHHFPDGSRWDAFAVPGDTLPSAFQNYTGSYSLEPFVTGGLHHDLSNKISFDGAATMSLRYL